MRVGIIGYGSIGKRHVNNLLSLKITDIILFRENGHVNNQDLKEVYTIQDLFNLKPDFIILANPTAHHFKYLAPIIENNISVLAEKPLIHKEVELFKIRELLKNYTGIGMTAFNLRFHPCIKKALELLETKTIGKLYHNRFFVGQYLPDWRPGVDYKKSYSANKELGGGVLFDLIHEIDLALLFSDSPAASLNSYIGNFGELEIETEDLVEINYISAKKILVNIHLDYLTRGVKRSFQLFGIEGWINCDLIENKLTIYKSDGNLEEFNFTGFERNHMYDDLLKNYISCFEQKKQVVPDLNIGLDSCSLALNALKNNSIK